MRLRALAVAVALTAALAMTGCSSSGDDHDGMHHDDAADSAAANRADVMFATMMIPHHEQAIQMSDLVLVKDDIDPQVRSLAEAVKAAQAPEIEQMRGWLDDWDAPGHAGESGHGGAMMGHEDLAALERAEGGAASRLFLEQMIEHHEGAVEMARTEVARGENAEATRLAQDIIAGQTAEIDQMRAMLRAP